MYADAASCIDAFGRDDLLEGAEQGMTIRRRLLRESSPRERCGELTLEMATSACAIGLPDDRIGGNGNGVVGMMIFVRHPWSFIAS
jgi:hypothetical protein